MHLRTRLERVLEPHRDMDRVLEFSSGEGLLRWVEKRMDGSDSYDLVQTDALTMSAGTYNHPSKGTPFDERSKEYRVDAWEEKGER